METTPYGYRLPNTGDSSLGALGWYTSLEFDISRLDSHNHDGTNSAVLSPQSIPSAEVDVLAANWAADGVGYKQTVTMPAEIPEINDYQVRFRQTAPAGRLGYDAVLAFKRLTATTVEIYTNDNTTAFVMVIR